MNGWPRDMGTMSVLAQIFPVLLEVNLLLYFCLFSGNDASVASFSDDRCDADGVCPSDPLTFTCEINRALSLRVELPNGYDDTVTLGNGPEDVYLPGGFTAVTLSITEIDNSSRDFVLTLSIANASLLAGGEIRCDDTTDDNVAMAGCPILVSPTPSNLRQLLSSNTPTTATIIWDSVDNAVSYTVRSTSLQSPLTGIEEESYTLTGLELETDYTISVTATNVCGVESPPQDITVRIDIQAPSASTLGDPLIGCSDNDETMALVEISWTYGESRPTTASGLVDAPVTGVEVSYRDDDGSNKNACVGVSDAMCPCDTMCTCGSVGVADTSCSLYLPLRDGLQYVADDDVAIMVVVQVSNGKTTESEIMLNAQLLEVKNDLDAVVPSVTLTLNQYCRNDYTVLITFGVRADDDDVCEGKLNVTREIEPNIPETIVVDTNVIKLENDQEYCYTGMISTTEGSVMMMSNDEECESAGLSTGATVGIKLAITLLVALPVGVALGCCGMWYMMRRGDTSGQKVAQLQAAIYEEPATPAVKTASIPLTDNQAYGHVNIHTRN